MSSTEVSADPSTGVADRPSIDMKLEVVTLPVSDVDRAKGFYESLGWRLDNDVTIGSFPAPTQRVAPT